MARPCKYCDPKSKQGIAFAAARKSGQTMLQAAKTAGIPNASAGNHDAHLIARAARSTEDIGPRPPLVIPPDASPLEKARIQEAWLGARLEWASRGGMTEKEMAALAGQRSAALRLLARLSGALDITEAQIVRSAPFARARMALDAALKYEGALTSRAVRERVEAEIARLLGE